MKVYSVSEFVQSFNALIEATLPAVAVTGEVSGFRMVQDRMAYFDLKDEKSKVLCFGLKWEIPEGIKDGMSLNIVGSPKLFVGSGQFHVRVKEVEFLGEGVLQKLFKDLMARLQKEGLFDEARKKPIPRYPETIGLITSQDAAAYTDVLKILKEKIETQVLFLPVKVQGLGSESSIVRGLEYFNKHNPVDVLLLVRGGGSMEDLQSFNSEKVARAIASSRIPVIVGVGHERDITIADLVADRRASTPTNAAEIVLPSKKEMREMIEGHIQSLRHEVMKALGEKRTLLVHTAHALELAFGTVFGSIEKLIGRVEGAFVHFGYFLSGQKQTMSTSISKLDLAAAKTLNMWSNNLLVLKTQLTSLDPKQVLKKGYTLTLKQGKLLKSRQQLASGDVIETRFSDGGVESVAR